jgi:hypothetical protein
MMLTGSGFTRAEKCTASTFLPHVIEAGGVYAGLGSALHRYLHLVAEVGAEAALQLIDPEYREACSKVELEGLPHSNPEGWAVEVAFAWDWLAGTGRELYRGSGARLYPALEPTELAGTADLVGLDGQTVIVLDLKSGWADLGRPEDSAQLQFYAVCAAAAYGASEAIVGFIRLVDGEPRYQQARLDAFALADATVRLQAIVDRCLQDEAEYRAEGLAIPVTGEHCKYCSAFLRCPAKATLAGQLAVSGTDLPALTVENAPLALERLWAAQEVLAKVEKAINELATSTPLRLSDGRIYGAVEATKESFDPLVGGEALAKAFGPELAAEAVEVESTLTKASIDRALRGRLQKGQKISKLQQEAFEAIRAAGGAKTAKWTQVKAFKPKAGT